MNKLSNYTFGAMPSPHDYRDYPVTSLIPTQSFPEEFTPKVLTKVKNQGSVGACVAYSISTIKEYQELRERGFKQEFSANFAYGNRADDHWQGEGMYPREALKMLQKYGICEEELMPGIWNYPHQKRLYNESIYKNALPQKIGSYALVNTFAEAKNAIFNNGPILIVIPIFRSFLAYRDGILPLPSPNEEIMGYHAIVAPAYYANGYVIQNSWHRSWGKEGFCHMPANYPISEKWALTDHAPAKGLKVFIPERDWFGWNELPPHLKQMVRDLVNVKQKEQIE